MCTHTYTRYYRLDTSAPCPDMYVKPNLLCNSIWKWGLWGVIRKLCHEWDWCPCKGDLTELFTMWRHTEKTVPYKPEGALTRITSVGVFSFWISSLVNFLFCNYLRFIPHTTHATHLPFLSQVCFYIFLVFIILVTILLLPYVFIFRPWDV